MFRRTESSITAITSGTASFIDDNLNVENGCDRDVSKLPPEVEQGNVEYKVGDRDMLETFEGGALIFVSSRASLYLTPPSYRSSS